MHISLFIIEKEVFFVYENWSNEKGDLAKTSKEVYINLELLKRYSQHSSLFLSTT